MFYPMVALLVWPCSRVSRDPRVNLSLLTVSIGVEVQGNIKIRVVSVSVHAVICGDAGGPVAQVPGRLVRFLFPLWMLRGMCAKGISFYQIPI
jgi:hypothetical protein